MQTSDVGTPSTNEDGRLLLELIRADVAANVYTDDEPMKAAIYDGIAAAVAELYPPQRPATGGLLEPADAAAVAMAVWPAIEGFVADELANPAFIPSPGVEGVAVDDLTTRELVRAALGSRAVRAELLASRDGGQAMTEAFPDGTRMLHIGPHKTGTTSLQAAFWEAQETLAAHGVLWAGEEVHPMDAAIAAATGGGIATTLTDGVLRRWRDLITEVERSDARIKIISSEFFSEAPPERVGLILDQLGREQTRVVVTLRPLTRILASQWQQYMQNQLFTKYPGNPTYEAWLEMILSDVDRRDITPSFWVRHRHDVLVRRWAEEVGPDRLTVVVVDDARPRGLLESFERLAGLPVGCIEPFGSSGNRSLTHPEVLTLVAFNERWTAEGRNLADYTHYVRWRAVRHLLEQVPAPDDPRINTPAWAIDRANEIGADMVASIRELDIRVDGDLDLLANAAPRSVGSNDPNARVRVEVAARLAAGMLKGLAGTPGENARDYRRVGPVEDAVRRSKMTRINRGEIVGRGWRLRNGDERVARNLSRVQLLVVVARRARRSVVATAQRVYPKRSKSSA